MISQELRYYLNTQQKITSIQHTHDIDMIFEYIHAEGNTRYVFIEANVLMHIYTYSLLKHAGRLTCVHNELRYSKAFVCFCESWKYELIMKIILIIWAPISNLLAGFNKRSSSLSIKHYVLRLFETQILRFCPSFVEFPWRPYSPRSLWQIGGVWGSLQIWKNIGKTFPR